jgi:hypothetical protein
MMNLSEEFEFDFLKKQILFILQLNSKLPRLLSPKNR